MIPSLTFREYSDRAWATAIYPDKGRNCIYPALGLGGETGEILEKLKKYQRDKTDIETLRLFLSKEMGDVLWYLNALLIETKIVSSQGAGDFSSIYHSSFCLLSEQFLKETYYLEMGNNYVRPAFRLWIASAKVPDILERVDNAYAVQVCLTDAFKEILRYLNALCYEFGLSLAEVAQENLDKLESRKERGMLHGSGDDR